MNGTESGLSAGFQLSDWLVILVPGAVALVLGILGVVALALAVHRKSWGWGIACVAALLLCVVSGAFTVVAGARVARKQVVKSSREWVVTSEDGQHHLTVPGHWKKDPTLAAEEPAIGVSNHVREQYLMLMNLPRGEDVQLKDWAEAVRTEMAGNIQDAVLGKTEARTVGEYPALFSRIAGRVDGMKIVYHVTFLQLPDEFVYILCWTLPARERAGFAVFDKVVASYTYTPSDEPEPTPAITYYPSAPIAERVQVLLANQLGLPRERVTPEADFRTLGFDDLDTVEFVMAMEEEFGSEIPDEVAEKLKTVGDVIRWAEAQKKTEPAASERAVP